MVMDKAIVFLLAGVLVGAGVGIGAGYMLWNDNSSEPPTYWFFIDFNGEGGEGLGILDTVWVASKGSNPADALGNALGSNVDLSEDDWGIGVSAIGGLYFAMPGGDYQYWVQWYWTGDSWAENENYLDGAAGTIFYLGYAIMSSATFEPDLDPNAATNGWDTTGPFAKA